MLHVNNFRQAVGKASKKDTMQEVFHDFSQSSGKFEHFRGQILKLERFSEKRLLTDH
jgi:hypothetical protein